MHRGKARRQVAGAGPPRAWDRVWDAAVTVLVLLVVFGNIAIYIIGLIALLRWIW